MRVSSIGLAGCTLCFAVAVLAAETDAKYAPRNGKTVGSWLKSLGGRNLPGEKERSNAAVTGAFKEVASAPSQCTVRVLSDQSQVAFGVIVRSDGWILTKASELDDGFLECVLANQTRVPAIRVAQRDDCDLALLRINKTNLPVVSWSESTDLAVGSWLVTTNLEPLPVAIGVVSAPLHESPTPRAVLGVRMFRVDNGVRINAVVPGTGAAKAGIKAGDVVTSINGRLAESPEMITNVISGMRPGADVKLAVLRDTSTMSVTARLGDLSRIGGLEQAELMDSLGGPLSRRRAGFPSVIQHDSIIKPRDCGGPVVDLDGKVVGINIARVSRVATYALPATVAKQVVDDMLQNIAATPVANQTASSAPR